MTLPAVERLAAESPDAERWVAIRESHVGDAYVEWTRIVTQCFGGVGYTWEYDIHLFLKRARLNQQLFGNPTHHRRRLAQLLCDDG